MKALIQQVLKRQISIRQAVLAVLHFVSPSRLKSGDDFNWDRYHLHYKEELKSISRDAKLVLDPSDVRWNGSKLVVDSKPPIMATHHTLYEAIAHLGPKSILEIGAGGGDHLANLEMLFVRQGAPLDRLTGIDRSNDQLLLAKNRHPELLATLVVADISDPSTKVPSADVVYSHAVLMHISEKKGRFQQAINRMVSLAKVGVVLQENWTQHDFLSAAIDAIQFSEKTNWRVFYHESSRFPGVRALVIAAHELGMPLLGSYEELLQGETLRPH